MSRMGWFGGQQEMRPDEGTIGDKQWRALQTRAGRANEQRASVASEQGRAARERAAANYRNRRWC